MVGGEGRGRQINRLKEGEGEKVFGVFALGPVQSGECFLDIKRQLYSGTIRQGAKNHI